MMGKGADGGCTTNGCTASAYAGILPLSKALVISRMNGNLGHDRRSSDVFSQALKSLAVKPAFGELGTPTAAASSLNTTISSDNKRKQRTKKHDLNGNLLRDPFENSWYKDSNGGPFWLFMEGYFREPSPQDIQLLVPKTRIDTCTPCGSVDPLLQMPVSSFVDKSVECGPPNETRLPSALNLAQLDTSCRDDQALQGVSLEQDDALKMLEQHRKSTKRKMVSSGPASKRRRIIDSITDRVTAIISPPENGDEELCHVCYAGESDEKNQILFCNSCNVAVHQECYGVKAVPEEQWLCSLCRHENDLLSNTRKEDSYDCAFCPVKGGALKPIASPTTKPCDGESRVTRFGHLFCCQWIPETYIGDTEAVEPIMNIEGVKEERWKLLCSICKDKHGACIQCSHGTCATAFHPLCARQAKLGMEVSSKANGEEADLLAFCSKHTSLNGKPVLGRQADSKIDDETVYADGSTMNMGCSSNTGKRLMMACSKSEDNQLLVNRGLSINVMKGLLGRDNSAAVDINGIQTKQNEKIEIIGKAFIEYSDDEHEAIDVGDIKDRFCRSYHKKRCRLEQQAITSQWQLEEDTHAHCPEIDTLGCSKSVDSTETQLDSLLESGIEYFQPTRSKPCDHYSEDGSTNNEERRLRGINGEASTSQDLSLGRQGARHSLNLLNVRTGQGRSGTISVLEENLCGLGDQIKIHPFLITRLLQVLGKIAPRDTHTETEKSAEVSSFSDSLGSPFLHKESPDVNVSSSRQLQSEICTHNRDHSSKSVNSDLADSFEAQLKQLKHAKNIGVLDMSSRNELEEEILAAQLNLVAQAEQNNCQCEQLVLKIIPRLWRELRASRIRLKNLDLVRQYLSMVREAKKQGRKERRSKEAQAVLAATTAVAAASSRLGALRKDAFTSKDEKVLTRESVCNPTIATSQSLGGCHAVRSNVHRPLVYGWTSSSQTSSCGKVNSLDQDMNMFGSENLAGELNSGESRAEPMLCDVCKDISVLNPTAICQRCKLVVHQQCYSINSGLTGDWFCQPCMDIKHHSQDMDVSDAVERATPGHGVLCLLCFGLTGAFKKAADGKWAHVFCLQWFPEFSDKDEAVLHEPAKMLSIEKVVQECSICHLKQGARLRCSFGHCHGSFHPLCARDFGLYMTVKRSTGGRIQLRAYCEKHSTQQRQKAASRKYGSSDELNVLLRMRAELERVRILCERVCKRERLKRERLLCTLDIYTAQLSSLSSSAMASNDLSSTSNTLGTTLAFRKMSSLHTHHNDAMALRPYHHGLESESLSWNSVVGEGSKYQDSISSDSVYQTQISCSERSRETIPMSQMTDSFHRQGRMNMFVGMVPKNCEQRRLGKHQKFETSHSELVMTPMEASVQNQRLPKGYAYVPVGTLPKGKVEPQ